MACQELLLPGSRSATFFPDIRVWTILYAWRMPGFDIDGNGFVGTPLNPDSEDQAHKFASASLWPDGQIEVDVPEACGSFGLLFGFAMPLGLLLMMVVPRWRRHR